MALFYLIRHGEPDYDAVAKLGFFGYGLCLAPLSKRGIEQVEMTADDKRLLEADIIVSSPYTRALETASIISRKTGKKIIIEPELHEWISDKTNTLSTEEEANALFKEFIECKGVYPSDSERKWEELSSLKERVERIADKYAKYNKVIFVAHGMVCKVLAYASSMRYAEIIECEYKEGQKNPKFF